MGCFTVQSSKVWKYILNKKKLCFFFILMRYFGFRLNMGRTHHKSHINHGLVAIIVLLNFSSKLCFLTFSHQDLRFISKHGSEKCSWRFNLFFGVENYPAFLHVCQPINQTR